MRGSGDFVSYDFVGGGNFESRMKKLKSPAIVWFITAVFWVHDSWFE